MKPEDIKHQAKILYESEGKAPNGQPFLTVKQARGYYEYSERPGMDSIAFVLYNSSMDMYGLIEESKPPMDERSGKEINMITAFGGSIDSADTPKTICQTEAREEAGYDVPMCLIKKTGKTMVSTQSSQYLYGYIVDVTSLDKTNMTEYEIQKNEDRTRWLTKQELLNNDDWKSIWITSKD